MSGTITSTQYYCASARRRDLVRAAVDAGNKPFLNGIDFVEISPADQKTIFVHFIHNVPGQTDGVPASPVLNKANFRIDGGVRVTGISLTGPLAAAGKVVTIHTSQTGDFSSYTLRLVTSAAVDTAPAGFDPMLAAVGFSFKVNCDSYFDCKQDAECLDLPSLAPHFSYLAKDYTSFRRLILDRLAVTIPEWRERNPADLGIALVELLAYTGDYLSYFQDSVATEAYLGTARKRMSVRRHARLVDYFVHDGVNARAWLVFETNADRGNALVPAIPQSTAVATSSDPNLPLSGDAVFFETLHKLVELRVSRNRILFYTWGDSDCCLPKGATRATLDGSAGLLSLKSGDVLVFEEVLGAETGIEEDADRSHRHAVRLVADPEERKDPLNKKTVLDIEWHSEDGLPFPLCLREFDDGAGGVKQAAVARGNVALAEHGRTFSSATPGEDLIPSQAPEGQGYRPLIKRNPLAQCVVYDAGSAQSAAAALRLDPRQALPALTLRGGGETWRPQRDLLSSDRFASEFVVETEEDGRARIRFGDGTLGRQPAAGASFLATYRLGNGTAGNVGAEALNRMASTLPGVKVRNPLPAEGGVGPEPLAEVRLFAPQAFRTQERAVTPADYVAAAQRHPEVQRAAATRRWTGSWYTMFITIDRRGGKPVDAAFEHEIRGFLDRFRMAGYDLEIDGPRYVPIEIVLTICVRPGYYRASVKSALLETFGNGIRRDGTRGFFHPDNFTFGQPVYFSQVVARAMEVSGVENVDADNGASKPNLFQRWGEKAQGEIANGLIPIHRLEIARLDSNPSLPENGRIDFVMKGGS